MMKFAAALLALAAVGVKAQYNATTTVITTDFTTYCSEATIFSHGGNTYTVTEPTVVTVTDWYFDPLHAYAFSSSRFLGMG